MASIANERVYFKVNLAVSLPVTKYLLSAELEQPLKRERKHTVKGNKNLSQTINSFEGRP